MNKKVVCAIIGAGMVVSGSVLASEELAKSKGCFTCHQVDKKVVGPGFKDVAQKYAGQADAEAALAEKVIKGGSGVWGQMPMPANPKVTPDEAKTLVQWILGLK
jgi:cytochrome c